MNTTTIMDEVRESAQESPGSHLARVRMSKGYTPEYVASKLNLRVRVIELLEADNYQSLPEAVFIRGYLRAYAKLLGVIPEPLLAIFNSMHATEITCEKALWQGQRQPRRMKNKVRFITLFIALFALIAAGLWWQKSKEMQVAVNDSTNQTVAEMKVNPEVKLTDLSRMQSMFSASNDAISAETAGG